MKLGEMLASPQFRLVDAMSAIEIMDAKMDSGYKNSEDMTLERAEEEGILATGLSHEEMIAIWDQMLMYYLLWLEGHTLVQTAFACLYLHSIEKHVRAMPLFGAFVDAFMVICRTAKQAITHAYIFDDEDFLPSSFGIDLNQCVYSSVPADVAARLKQEQSALSTDQSATAKALRCRFEFMSDYMMSLA